MNWLRKNYQYEFWAIQCYIDSINKIFDKSKNDAPVEIIRLLSHIVVAQHIWIHRLLDTHTNLEPWTLLGIEEIQGRLNENKKMFEEFLSSINEQSLDKYINYQNSKGTVFSTKIADILNHLTHHSAYHRGQLSLFFKNNSFEIPSTDYIFYVRLES